MKFNFNFRNRGGQESPQANQEADTSSQESGQSPETPQEAKARQDAERGQRIDQAMNDPKFLNFLKTNYQDYESLDYSNEGGQELAERVEVFEKSTEVSSRLREVLSNLISSDSGINISARELECVDGYVLGQSVEKGPQFLDEITGELDRFDQNNQALVNLRQEIVSQTSEIGRKQDALTQVQDISKIKRHSGRFGRFFMSAAEKAAVDNASELGIGKLDADLRITEDKLQEQAENLESIKQAEIDSSSMCQNAREALLDGLGKDSKALEIIQNKIKERIFGVRERARTSAQMDQAQAQFESIIERYRSEDLGEKWQRESDEKIKNLIKDETERAITNVRDDSREALFRMEDKLQSLFDRRDNIILGSEKSQEEINNFIGVTIAEVYRKQGLSEPKKMLLLRVCAKRGMDLKPFLEKHDNDNPPDDDNGGEAETGPVGGTDGEAAAKPEAEGGEAAAKPETEAAAAEPETVEDNDLISSEVIRAQFASHEMSPEQQKQLDDVIEMLNAFRKKQPEAPSETTPDQQ